jgi:hypothetical protein
MEEPEMPVRVRKAVLWRCEVDNTPGVLAEVLEPLAEAGADLQVVMAYRYPGNETRAAIEVFPITTRKAQAAARAAGLTASAIPTLLVEGDNRPGLGYAITRAIADAGINMGFVVTQVIGRRYSCVLGFENEEAARRASAEIRKATARRRR